ncbi:FHA domain-containing protein [Tropicimonas sediminicola]|uniref:FHA domain-containing protein n=1 Tax=Tropicimonas sediminicola TaxID=1031541 RepID=A0A239JP31_9RHOB|nr:FHA domain-containing protein [Tropicimonas sediminicola]SNT07776.1 FHA domain-containing protein [Tropicimonas sediminicola]
MRFISELIEKKKAAEPDASNQEAKVRATGGLALHDATRRRPVSLIDESYPSSGRRRDTSGWGADPDDLADTLGGGPDMAGDARPRNGFHQSLAAVRRTEIPREHPSDAGTPHPLRQCGRAAELGEEETEVAAAEELEALDDAPETAADDTSDAPFLLTDDASAEPENEVAEDLDEAARAERNIDLAFETPLKAVSASALHERPAAGFDHQVETETAVGALSTAEDDLDASTLDAAPDTAAGEGTPDLEEAVGNTLRIWDLDNEADAEEEAALAEADDDFAPAFDEAASGFDAPSEPAALPQEPDLASSEPAPERFERPRAGRVKTRLLGFHRPEELEADPFAAPERSKVAAVAQFPVGWLVVVRGPGRGASHALFQGVSTIGRGDDQTVPLDHGDTSISRQSHAAIAYDEEQNAFFIGHGGKANLVRLNGMPVLSTEPLANGDEIRIGETTLRFVALCGSEFSWGNDDDAGPRDAATI